MITEEDKELLLVENVEKKVITLMNVIEIKYEIMIMTEEVNDEIIREMEIEQIINL
jgi:hypothetical protein